MKAKTYSNTKRGNRQCQQKGSGTEHRWVHGCLGHHTDSPGC